MKPFFFALLATLLAWNHANAQTISASGTRICVGGAPHIRVNLYVNPPDKNLSGLIYVGSHDSSQTQAEFFYENQWIAWESGLYPIYMTFRSGLNDMTFVIPFNRISEKLGWRLYVGYGALSVESEQKVGQITESYERARTKLPDRVFHTVEPDHIRRTLIQMDMLDNLKYQYIAEWTSDLRHLCD
jgi:hypothetical protein